MTDILAKIRKDYQQARAERTEKKMLVAPFLDDFNSDFPMKITLPKIKTISMNTPNFAELKEKKSQSMLSTVDCSPANVSMQHTFNVQDVLKTE